MQKLSSDSAGNARNFGIRLGAPLAARVSAIIRASNQQFPPAAATVIRAAIAEGLGVLEKRLALPRVPAAKTAAGIPVTPGKAQPAPKRKQGTNAARAEKRRLAREGKRQGDPPVAVEIRAGGIAATEFLDGVPEATDDAQSRATVAP